MFKKLKTTILAAVTATATLLGSGQAWALTNGPDARVVYQLVQGGSGCEVNVERGHGGWSFAGFSLPRRWETYVWTGAAWLAPSTFGGIRSDADTISFINQCLVSAGYPAGSTISNFQSTRGGLGNNFGTMSWLGFSFDFEGVTYRFGLEGAANTSIVDDQVPAPPANQAPTANAGSDQMVASATDPVTLDGTGSSDPDAGQTLTYAWTQTSGPDVALSDAAAAQPTFTARTLAAGDADISLTFELTVTDDFSPAASSAPDTVTITLVAGVSVELSGGPDQIINTDPFNVTASFSGPVREFDDLASDVMVSNGSVTAISGGPSVYTLTIQPSGNGDVEITVPADAARLDRNDIEIRNTVSNTFVIGNQIVEITQEAIAGFMLGRANNLASNQPGLTRFLMGDGCGNFSANATEGAGSINGCVSHGNTWAELTGAWAGNDSYTLASFGAHSFVNPNLLIGGMLQFDHADDSANKASGSGYMIGPYFVAKAPEQPLFFEGRLLYGQTDNTISPLGTYTDSFETERWLAQLRTTGEYQYQNTTLMPLLDLTYTDDTQQAYTDSLGNTIPGQTVSLMQVTAGLDFSQPLPVQTGALELTGGLSGIYSSTDGAAASPEFENWRGRTHLGLNYDTGQGATARVGIFYDGLGTNFESYGADFGLDWRF